MIEYRHTEELVFEVVNFVATTRLRAKRDAGAATPAKDHLTTAERKQGGFLIPKKTE